MRSVWQKGQSGNPNGRPKGSHNNITHEISNSILKAFKYYGGNKGFIRWCGRNLDILYTKGWIERLPRDFTISGEIDNNLTIEVIKFSEKNENNTTKQLDTKTGSDSPLGLS